MAVVLGFLGLLAVFVAFSFLRRGVDPNYRKQTDDLYGQNQDKDGPDNA